MAKSIVEKPPFVFNSEALSDTLFDFEYISRYQEVDQQGRYLYWDQLKWRIDENHDAKKAWYATKLARSLQAKTIDLRDKTNKTFSFCMPDTLQAKLYKISNLAGQGIIPHVKKWI